MLMQLKLHVDLLLTACPFLVLLFLSMSFLFTFVSERICEHGAKKSRIPCTIETSAKGGPKAPKPERKGRRRRALHETHSEWKPLEKWMVGSDDSSPFRAHCLFSGGYISKSRHEQNYHYPGLPNTLWGGIWTQKTNPKDLLSMYLED